MFQRLDELQTGSLYILTGMAGAGKSHLASSARRSGTLWVLDTEGASQNLQGKPGIHRRIQVVQTLSLRQLLAAMDEVKAAGKVGDTVVLDSISKVFQAMRAHAQQRAGAETDKRTAIGFDEHASVNRNMQAVYTGLTELKQAGFHVIIIGHLGRKYKAGDSGLQDEGLRVLADDQIAYEADAILLVEREGEDRAITPIIKPPRPAHLKMGKRYAAQLATLYPDLAVDKAEKAPKTKTVAPKVEAPVAHADDDADDADDVGEPAQVAHPVTPEAPVSASPNPAPPKTAAEAEQRFFARYSEIIGGNSWQAVQRYLDSNVARPTSVEGWISLAEAVRDRSRRDSSPAIAA